MNAATTGIYPNLSSQHIYKRQPKNVSEMGEHLTKTELCTEISMYFVPHFKTGTKSSLPLRVSYQNL